MTRCENFRPFLFRLQRRRNARTAGHGLRGLAASQNLALTFLYHLVVPSGERVRLLTRPSMEGLIGAGSDPSRREIADAN
jgi:hypothetical protein